MSLHACPSCGVPDGAPHVHAARPPRPSRREVAYRRFLVLDHHRAEAGRLILALEVRHRLLEARARRVSVARDGAFLRSYYAVCHAQLRWDALARLAARARGIARRLGAFDRPEVSRG